MKKNFKRRDPPMGGSSSLFVGNLTLNLEQEKSLCAEEIAKRNIHEKCNLCR